VKFVDVTRESGIAEKLAIDAGKDAASTLGPGACFLDFDDDGKLDLFVTDNGAQGGMTLYHNLGGGKFEDATKKAGLDPTLHGIGCTVGDYDNDGLTDLVVTTRTNVILLHNEKDGKFKDASQAAESAGRTKSDIC